MITTYIIFYLILGLLFSVYNWFIYKEKEYQKCIDRGENPEDGMAILYMVFVMIIWPVFVIYRFINNFLK